MPFRIPNYKPINPLGSYTLIRVVMTLTPMYMCTRARAGCEYDIGHGSDFLVMTRIPYHDRRSINSESAIRRCKVESAICEKCENCEKCKVRSAKDEVGVFPTTLLFESSRDMLVSSLRLGLAGWNIIFSSYPLTALSRLYTYSTDSWRRKKVHGHECSTSPL